MAKVSRFEVLAREGAGMTMEQRAACVRGLFADARFAGLLAFVANERDEYVRAGADQALAGSPGKQSHALGSYFALDGLLNALRGVTESKGKVASEDGSGVS